MITHQILMLDQQFHEEINENTSLVINGYKILSTKSYWTTVIIKFVIDISSANFDILNIDDWLFRACNKGVQELIIQNFM